MGNIFWGITNGELLTFYASIIAGGISAISTIVAVLVTNNKTAKAYEKEIRRQQLLRAPLLSIDQYVFEDKQYEFMSESGRHPSRFSFDRRSVKLTRCDGSEETKPRYSLLVDIGPESPHDLNCHKMIGFGKMLLKNVGYALQVLEIEGIKIVLDSKEISVMPTEHNKVSYNLLNNDVLELLVSGVFTLYDGKMSDMFDYNKIKSPDFRKSKVILMQGNLLNTYFPEMGDIWKDIYIYCIVTNIHNERFKQIIHMFIKDSVYYADAMLVDVVEKTS
jgi:hypothetical protein